MSETSASLKYPTTFSTSSRSSPTQPSSQLRQEGPKAAVRTDRGALHWEQSLPVTVAGSAQGHWPVAASHWSLVLPRGLQRHGLHSPVPAFRKYP